MNDLVLIKIDEARRALAEATSVVAVKDVRDRAMVIERYLRQKEGAGEAAVTAAELKLRAERRLGELLKADGERRGGQSKLHDGTSRPGGAKPLPDGITKTQSHRFQKVAAVPAPVFEQQLSRAKAEQEPSTTQAMIRVVKEAEREQKREDNRKLVEETAPPQQVLGTYPTVVIDPPWDWGDEGDVDHFGRGKPTYETMSLDKLLELPVPELAEKDAHLYLWITNRSLPKGFALLDRWGFRYVTCLTWCKPSIGMGNYFRGSTEQVLFGVRGSLPLLRADVGTWFAADRAGRHSAKPDAFFKLVESCSPGPWLEMFARNQRPGWRVWGAEA